ncbi:N-acetylmuramoyl-L-alanine amidase [Desulfitobacterium dehalogenans ATCC 51507]|uniref:N-acetylmuramoyl-L-alanine amidase n=1 Tax=Desulfitobacterium dehalogenans (strain ATCC 51507 / DSM 9161 / JW/IU-DC1) TaxID=756499 RepID=I4ADT4_DESDJ|nr:N-acetylmuramoyl-L-alanine amidase [Desulfitobacterium dehalogenans]AFM02119.1 N-acetylmuramoyl-L-alanine amidase [Desulfitobacterium dehalogenans ATCC 51507]
MWPRRKKWSLVLGAAFSLWLMGQASVDAAPLTADVTRIYGTTRIETAIRISQEGWNEANTVLLARYDDFPDSLVAVPLSKRYDAPILLTPSRGLDEGVLAEIKRLNAQHVILLGGTGVMGNPVTKALEKEGLTWERIGGADRYETAVMVAERLGGNGQVILTSGENFPDALAIGPYAGMTETPLLLTKAKGLPEATRLKLEELGAYRLNQEAESVTRTTVIGGEKAVSSEVVAGLTGMTRISGDNRYDTAAKVFWFTQEEFGQDFASENQRSFLVTGENFPDALVTGALAVKQNAYLFMSYKEDLPAVTYSALGNAAAAQLLVTIIGGDTVLSERVKGIVEGTIQPPYLLAGLTIVVDPGHGGKDVGAVGASGSYEKNSTLPVGLNLADLLRQAGAKVVMTRTGDTSPAGADYTELKDLQARVKIANQIPADLYVSIHNDAFSNPEAGGVTTYISADNPKAEEGRKLASAVQQELIKQVGLQDRKVKTANFYVIKNTTMPAILVELGFISNPVEEKLITDPEFQKKSALGIYRGILIHRGY